MLNKTFSLLEVLIVSLLLTILSVFAYKSLSAAILQSERSSNKLAQVIVERTFAQWDISEAVTPIEFNGMDQEQRRHILIQANQNQLSKRNEKNFSRIITQQTIPDYGKTLDVNTDIPPETIWTHRSPTARVVHSITTIVLLGIVAFIAIRPKKGKKKPDTPSKATL